MSRIIAEALMSLRAELRHGRAGNLVITAMNNQACYQ